MATLHSQNTSNKKQLINKIPSFSDINEEETLAKIEIQKKLKYENSVQNVNSLQLLPKEDRKEIKIQRRKRLFSS